MKQQNNSSIDIMPDAARAAREGIMMSREDAEVRRKELGLQMGTYAGLTVIEDGKRITQLLKSGTHPDEIVPYISRGLIVRNHTKLDRYGADLNINTLAPDREDAPGVDRLLKAGADPTRLANKLDQYSLFANADRLIEAGAQVDKDRLEQMLDRMDNKGVSHHALRFLRLGLDPDLLIDRLVPTTIVKHLDELLAHGVDRAKLIAKLRSSDETRAVAKRLRVSKSTKISP
jgi:hypothetical protein